MEDKPRLLSIFNVLSLLLLGVATWMSLYYAPQEAVMGDVQRIFYFHVSAGWVGMFSFFVAVIAGIALLVTKDRRFDVVGMAAVELGLVYILINIITGSIWARPVWNTWWTWDPRLVTATIMELVYLAYIMLRQGIEDPDRRARFGAVYAIVGFISVPLTFLSIRFSRTIHPVIIGANDPSAKGTFDMVGDMKTTFFFSLFTFTILGVTLLWHRIRLGLFAEKVEQLKMKVLS
ncbi:MAG: cytochrome c biogenesis protein CcsA [Anaerolineae bacterium]|nr:cytochrome c biogenesis protein CcsA [Anaerolineae bacterium]